MVMAHTQGLPRALHMLVHMPSPLVEAPLTEPCTGGPQTGLWGIAYDPLEHARAAQGIELCAARRSSACLAAPVHARDDPLGSLPCALPHLRPPRPLHDPHASCSGIYEMSSIDIISAPKHKLGLNRMIACIVSLR